MNYLFKQTYEVLQNLIDYIETHVFNKIGAAGGLATLNEDGKVPNSQIGIEPMTQAEASEGVVEDGRLISPKVLATTISEKVSLVEGEVEVLDERTDNINERLETVEQLAEISIGGGDIGIATAEDFDDPSAAQRAKVPTVGAILDCMDEVPTPNSVKPVQSGGVLNSVIRDGSAFDLSAHTGGSYASLTAALTAMSGLPAAYKKGGMSIKFIQSSDNKYVQYRFVLSVFTTGQFTDVSNWVSEKDIYDRINDVKYWEEEESGLVHYFFNKGGRIPTTTSSIDPTNINQNDNYEYLIVDCVAGDVFTFSVSGMSSSYRPWSFIDSNNNVIVEDGYIYQATSNSATTTIIAPTGASKLILNTSSNSAHECVKKGIGKDLSLIKGILSSQYYSSNDDGKFMIYDGYYDSITGEEKPSQYYAYVRTSKLSPKKRTVNAIAPNGYQIAAYIWINGTYAPDRYTKFNKEVTLELKDTYNIAFSFRKNNGNSISNDDKAFLRRQFLIFANNKSTDNIATEYSSTEQYSVGDLVMHGVGLYKCISMISVPEEWNGQHWKQTNISDELDSLNYAICGGEVTYNKTQIDTMPKIYNGQQIKIEVGKTLAEAHKNNSNKFTNILFTLPINTTSVTYKSYRSFYNYGSMFLNSEGVIIDGFANTVGPEEIITLDVPNEARYFVYSLYNVFADYNVIIKGSGLTSLTSLKLLPIGLHTKPKSIGVLNAIKRARQITDIKWVPSFNIPRTSIVQSLNSNHEYFEDVFLSGKEYKGIPYCDFLTQYEQIIGISRPFDVFMTSIVNLLSVEGLESQYDRYKASFYGCSCTGLTAYALGLPYTYSGYYNNIEGMRKMFDLVSGDVRHSLKEVQLADIIQKDGHCAMITDIYMSKDNEVELLEICEQTRMGNPNKNVLGSLYGGIARRFTMTPDEFFTEYAEYCIMRYAYIDNVKYIPTKYSPIQDEGERIDNPYFPVIPYYGNMCLLNGGATCKLLIASAGYTHLIVKKNGTEWNENGTTEPYSITGLSDISITCDADEAVYTAELATFSGTSIQYETISCEWYVKGSVLVSAVAANGIVTFIVKTIRNEFLPWFANIKRTDTLRGYNHIIFDDYEYEFINGYHQYTFDVEYSEETPTAYIIGLRSDKYGAQYITGTIS